MAETTTFPGADGLAVTASVATPSTEPRGGIVVIHEIEGLTEHFADLCDRFAASGFAAIAPDLFGRSGEARRCIASGDVVATLRAVAALGADRWLADADAAAWHLAARTGLDRRRFAITGFCFGGLVTLLAATTPEPGWAAAAPFYGPPAGYGNFGLTNIPAPLERATGVGCPMLMVYGRDDPYIPVADVESFAEAARRAGGAVEVVIEDAGHAFVNDSRGTYDKAAATHAWDELMAFLTRNVDG